MSVQIGEVIDGKYRVVRLIGEGGMGAVFEAENVVITRRVAIKVLNAGAAVNATVVQRFEREAQAAGKIGSDHILEILDMGTLPGGDRYMVMEYLDGETLGARIHRFGRLTPHQCLPLFRQILDGLAAAHAAQIIHRDLKPENIFILSKKAGLTDFVKIIDFGISKFQILSGDHSMTRTGAVMGTPYYLSPEQANGSSEADARSDVYSLGVMLYEAVTGVVPFDGKTFNELMFKIVLADPVLPQAIVPELDHAFSTIIAKAMARDPAQRIQSTAMFAQALDGWAAAGSPVTEPPGAWSAASHVPPGSIGAPPVPAAFAVSTTGVPAGVTPMGTPLPHPGPGGVAVVPGAQTTSAWANSHAAMPAVPKKSILPLVVAAGVIGVIVISGGAFAAYRLAVRSTAGETTAQPVEAPTAPVEADLPPPPAIGSAPPAAEQPATPEVPQAGDPAGAKEPGPGDDPAGAKPVAPAAGGNRGKVGGVGGPGPNPGAKPAEPGGTDFGY